MDHAMPGKDQSNKLMDAIVTDHREVEQMFRELEQGVPEPADRRALVDKVIIELVRHSVAEEQLLYPAARKLLPDGDETADRELAEHAEAERTMDRLHGLDAENPEFEPLLRQLMTEIREHVHDEESMLLPRLTTAAGLEGTNRMGSMIEAAKKVAPTRPHPDAPDTPPGNVMNSFTGLVDRMRDAFSGRGR
ncbi:hemerythrin domain-containing protein [Pseudonocardia nigra]|uniref:hemerythrin domain-containing protein n=1 Tax=Pseudonocardia nigra TaxID=1921578 RepID=UPI0027E2B898|nr:hemerythrin domain-containing protein [Pseudonocardia nigra]